jgi:hypothetical protein
MQLSFTGHRGRKPVHPLIAVLGAVGLAACADGSLHHRPGGVATAPLDTAQTLYTRVLPCVGRLVERNGGGTIALVPDLFDGDEPRQGSFVGLGPRRLANSMALAAVQNLGTARVVAANDLAAARRHVVRGGRGGPTRARILVVTGGTLAEERVATRHVGFQGGYAPVTASLQTGRERSQFHMTLGTMDAQGISIPGMAVELNAYISQNSTEARLGVSTGLATFTIGLGTGGISVTRAQISQILTQAAVMAIVARVAGVDPAPCFSQALPVAIGAADARLAWPARQQMPSPSTAPAPASAPWRNYVVPQPRCRCT